MARVSAKQKAGGKRLFAGVVLSTPRYSSKPTASKTKDSWGKYCKKKPLRSGLAIFPLINSWLIKLVTWGKISACRKACPPDKVPSCPDKPLFGHFLTERAGPDAGAELLELRLLLQAILTTGIEELSHNLVPKPALGQRFF